MTRQQHAFQSASTLSEKIVVFGAAAGLISFFLPRVSGFGGSASGFTIARQASGYLWLLPLSFAGCFYLAYLNMKAAPRPRLLNARWFLVVGTLWSGISGLATRQCQSRGPDPMALNAGTQLGPCQITGPLGKGGMGEVYRATDTHGTDKLRSFCR